MNICAVAFLSPVNRLANTQIERELTDDLPLEKDIRSAAKAIRRRNGKSIQHIVLVKIDAVLPVTGIEGLDSESKTQWRMVYGVGCKVIRHILRQAEAIRNW